MEQYYHSVRLDRDKCMGCTNCIKRCPTEAIRVRNGKASITAQLCIDCGECIRICPHFAKIAVTDPFSAIDRFKYRIALPAPTLYGQFKNLLDVDNVTQALLSIGFDDVFDVARAADIVTIATKEYIENNELEKPIISSACPAVLRLIQVRFPLLLGHVLPLQSPMEMAARIAKEEFCKKHNVPMDQVGAFFITPCAAKMTAVRNPIGTDHSYVDGCLSIVEIYGYLSTRVKPDRNAAPVSDAKLTQYGVGWAATGGEVAALGLDSYLAVDGIESVISVLEEIENDKLSDLDFFEGLACVGGCVGGPLVFENKFVAKNRIRKVAETLPDAREYPQQDYELAKRADIPFSEELQPRPSMKLDDNIAVALRKMEQLELIVADLPGLDCGSCGAPTCRALAHDIVLGEATELDCIFKLRDKIGYLAKEMVGLADADESAIHGNHDEQ